MIKNIFISLSILLISSCALFNKKNVSVPIKSSPSGASIYIDGQYYGETPAIVTLNPAIKKYRATIIKKGYGTSNIDLETWQSVRGGRGSDTTRCVLDALGTMLVFPIIGFYSTHCRDFKKREYVVDIGHNNINTDPNSNSEIMNRDSQRQNYHNNKTYNGDYGSNKGVYGGYDQNHNQYNSGY